MAERVTQLYLEYDWNEPPQERVTQLYAEYDWVVGSAERVTQLYAEYDYTQATPPLIAAVVQSYRHITVTLTREGNEATSYRLHRSTSSGFTPGPANLIADGLAPGWTVEDAPLVGGTTFYYVAVGVADDLSEELSPEVGATTLPQLAFVLSDSTHGYLQHAADAVAIEIQYQTTLSTDPTFASPVHDELRFGTDRYFYFPDGLTLSTDYLSRARTRLSAADPWEVWSASVPWSTTATSDVVQDGIVFDLPEHGHAVSGTEAKLTWIPAGAGILDIEISGDFGATWQSVAFTQHEATFDSTALADGPYIARGTVLGACDTFYHSGFYVANTTEVYREDDFFNLPRPAVARYWSPTVPRWLTTNQAFKLGTGHIGPAPMATFGPIDPPELTATRGVCVMAEAVAIGNGVGFSWDRCQAGELLDLGLVVLGAGAYPAGTPVGVRIGIKHHFLSTAHQSDPNRASSPFRFVGVAQASSHTRFELGIGEASVQPGGGWHQFSEPCSAAMSWTAMSTTIAGEKFTSHNEVRPYRFLLWVTRPDPGNFPNRLHVRGSVDAPDAWSCNSRRFVRIDEVVDVERPLEGGGTEPYTFEPGHVAFLSDKVPGNRDGDSGRWLMNWSVMLLEEPGVPEPPEQDTPELIARACDLVLEVFEDDRETVKWAAGTTASHDAPYLVMPDRYAEQEIDVAAGGATIGTITVTVIDPAQTPGDQDTGWMTAKLAELGLADIKGRRARLNRFVNAPEGLVPMVIIDGVAGEPRMDPSYAAFAFEIRDTRETERKVRLTETGNPLTLLPAAVLEGYGYDADSATYLIDPATPLLGVFKKDAALFASNTGYVMLITDPGNPDAQRHIPKSYRDAMAGTVYSGDLAPEGLLYRTVFTQLSVLWRAQGSSDPWTEIGETLVIDGHDDLGGTGSIQFLVKTQSVTAEITDSIRIDFGDSAAVPNIPAHNQDVELVVISRKPASETTPLYLEGLTVGELTKNAYDGLYSPRDADNNVVPSGIRYDTAAVLAMTEPIRMKLTAPVDDVRTWLEKVAYAATGRAPALDAAGRISPVSQIPPTDLLGLPVVDNAVTEPSAEWSAGQRIINVVRFTYARDYLPEEPDETDAADGLATRPVLMEFRDEVSILRNGEQVLDVDGALFRAIGTDQGGPLLGLQAQEEGFILAQLRQLYVLYRYSLGAPSFTVNVRREPLIELRAGSWVRVNLSWFPDYITGRRGLIALCQVMAIADLDCAWRRLTLEVAFPLELGS